MRKGERTLADYTEFLLYANDQRNEMTYDIASHLRNSYGSGITISQEDIRLITEIAINANYSVLRQYHEWMNLQP